MSLEKIINDAWEIKDQINQNSNQEIKNLSLFLKEIRLLKSK